MIWSIYNYLFELGSNIYLYNSYTNNLMRFDIDDKYRLESCAKGEFADVASHFLEELKKQYVVIDNDINIYNRIKLERTLARYNKNYLSLTIAPTTACNFRCSYCYESGIKSKNVLDEEKMANSIIKFTKIFKNTNYLRVTWYGGEPLLKFGFIERLSKMFMQEYPNYQAFMITNGYLLDDEKISKLKHLKIMGLQITIDGLEQVHNKRRPHYKNADSYKRIVHNIDNLFFKYPDVRVALRVNIDKSNSEEYHKLYNFMTGRYHDYKINIHPGYVTDDFSSKANCNCMDFSDRGNFVIKQHDLYGIPISLYPKPSFGECSARHLNSFVIGPSGELYKCWNDIGLQDKEIGNISDFSNLNSLCLKYLLANDPLESDKCKKCFCFPICDGGCPFKRIFSADSFLEDFCSKREAYFKELIIKHTEDLIKKE